MFMKNNLKRYLYYKQMLNVSDTEVQFFKLDLEKFNKIDLQIKELKNQMKPLQEKLKEDRKSVV